jgi:hypothetical protein
MARGTWLTGFGWGAVGYAHVDGPLAALFSWVGVYGVTAVAALLAMLLAQLTHSDSWAQARGFGLAALVLVLLSWWLPASQSQPDQTISVSLLQGNIAQEEKFQPQSGIPAALNWYGTQLANSSTDLAITPETALAVLPDQLPDGYWQALSQRFASNDQAALVGVPMGSYTQGYTNSVAGFKAGQSEPWRYDKHHLVPFGEFIPPFFRWFTNLMNIPLGDFNRGALPQPTFDWHSQRLAVSICFENLFGEELAKQFIDPDRCAHLAGQREQPGLVRQQPGDGPTPAHCPRALTGIWPCVSAGHQHRAHRSGEFCGPDHTRLATTHSGRFDRPGARPHWQHRIRQLGVALGFVAAVAAGSDGAGRFFAQRPSPRPRRLRDAVPPTAMGSRKIAILRPAHVFHPTGPRLPPLATDHADLPTNHSEIAVLLGRPGLRIAATL